MRRITQEELDKIIEQHRHWLNEDCEGWEGMKANLSCANLSCTDLSDANLSCADLRGADLRYANLSDANLRYANLSDANLRGADLSDANLSCTDLSDANLSGADLSCTDLSDANLRGADLSDANLRGADLSCADRLRLGRILTEPLTGYKKTSEGVVITAEIPAGAIVFCINGKKCRTNRAKITDMAGHDVLHSSYDNSFEYRLGQEIEIKEFNLMYNVECASGFHFFESREDAENF